MAVDLKPESAVVHFGMHKTGTSSIQESLFQNLKDPRFYYVNFGMANASTSICTAFRANPAQYSQHVKSGISENQLQQLKEKAIQHLGSEMSNSNGRISILSGENIGHLAEREIEGLRNYLMQQGKSVKAMAYVRRPKEYMESAFQQRVKGGQQDLDVDKLFPKYFSRFNKFDTVIGKENVILRLFEPKSFSGNCVIQDFCEQLGIDFLPKHVIRVNDALSLPALSLLFAYRKFGPGYGVGPRVLHENKLLIDRLRELPGSKLRFHSTVVGPVIEKNRDDIEWMEKRLGVSLAEDITRDDEAAIRSEKDLLKFTPESLHWLAEQFGWFHIKRCRPDMSPQEVAVWVHKLRQKLSGEKRRMPRLGSKAMQSIALPSGTGGSEIDAINPKQLVELAKNSNDELGVLNDREAKKLLLEVFKLVSREIDKTENGTVKIEGMGGFLIKQPVSDNGENKIPGKRIVFRPAITK